MSEPALVIERRDIPPGMGRHPLASLAGIELMLHLMRADKVWRGCTKPQRALLESLCLVPLARLLAAGTLTADELPVLDLPGPRIAALQRRRLVDDDGRLTAHAVYTYYWVKRFREPPVVDAPLPEPPSGDVYPLAVQQ